MKKIKFLVLTLMIGVLGISIIGGQNKAISAFSSSDWESGTLYNVSEIDMELYQFQPRVSSSTPVGYYLFVNYDSTNSVSTNQGSASFSEMSLPGGLILPSGLSTYDSIQLFYNSANDQATLQVSHGNQAYTTGSTVLYYSDELPADSTDPSFENGNYLIVTNVDDPEDLDDLIANIQAFDETDGDITDQIIVTEDNYTANMNTVGTYSVTLSVSDAAGNTTTLDILVRVQDATAPVISGKTSYDVGTSSLYSLSTVLAGLSITDNVDGTISTSSMTKTSDSYTANYATPGTYYIVYSVEDAAGNISDVTITMNVTDNGNPVITGTSSYTLGLTGTLTVATIQAGLSASDAVDGNITSSITVKSDNYTGYADAVGNYAIVFQVSDAAGNTSEFTVNIVVTDDIPPIFIVDDTFIFVSSDMTLTDQDFIDILVALGKVNATGTVSYSINATAYYETPSTAGDYDVNYSASSNNGEYSEGAMIVTVTSSDGDIVQDYDDAEFSWENVKAWFVEKWESAKTFYNEHTNAIHTGICVVIIGGVILYVYKKKEEQPKSKKRK